jgi:hypothetical protein
MCSSYEVSLGAAAATIFDLVFPDSITTAIIRSLLNLLTGGSDADFLLNRYLPTLRQALMDANVIVGFKTRISLFFKSAGTFIKLVRKQGSHGEDTGGANASHKVATYRQLYAFYWQETVLKGVYSPVTNFIGALAIPKLNKLCNLLNHYDFSDDLAVQKAFRVYPGDRACRKQEPHSKWHEESANGLVDFAFLSDDVAKVIGKGAQISLGLNNTLLQCYIERDCISGFNWSVIAPRMSATFESCFSEAAEGCPQLYGSGFLGCMVSSFVSVGNTVSTPDEEAPERLDRCLVDNDCIGFNGARLDVGRLKECIGFGSLVCRCYVHQ